MSQHIQEFWARLCAVMLLADCCFLVWAINIDGSWPRPFIEYWPGCFTSHKDSYRPGEPIKLRIVATKQSDLAGDVSWSLVNRDTGEVTYFATRQTTLGPGLNDTLVRVGVIPTRIDPGHYRLDGLVTYNVNPLRMITYRMQSNLFAIEGGADGS